MFGQTHPTLLRLEQVALQMRLMLLDPQEEFGPQACQIFRDTYGGEFNESAFESTISFYRQPHYLAIRPAFPGKPYKVSYIGVHSSTGELVVFMSRRNPYPEYLPDHTHDIMALYSPGSTPRTDLDWAARNALNFFLWED